MRQRLHQAAAGRPLPGQRLDHAGQLRPPQAQQRPGDQLGDPAALGRGGAVGLGANPGVEALDQADLLVGQQRPEQPGDEVRPPAGSGRRRRRPAGRPWSPAATSTAPRPCRGSCPAPGPPRGPRRRSRLPRPPPWPCASVESESITTSSSTRGVWLTRVRDRAPTTPATVRSSFRAGITTLIRVPWRCFSSIRSRAGQSCQREVRRRYQDCSKSPIPAAVSFLLPLPAPARSSPACGPGCACGQPNAASPGPWRGSGRAVRSRGSGGGSGSRGQEPGRQAGGWPPGVRSSTFHSGHSRSTCRSS